MAPSNARPIDQTVCPDCRTHFNNTRPKTGQWECTTCHGQMIGFAMLGKLSNASFVDRLTVRGPMLKNVIYKKCPFCAQSMETKSIDDPELKFKLDVCHPCHSVWFDSGEMTKALWKRFPTLPQPKIPEPDAPLDGDVTDLNTVTGVEAVFGLINVDASKVEARYTPWLTYTFAAVLVIAQAMITTKPLHLIYMIFDSSHPFRLHGLTMLASSFAHTGAGHLLGNLFFLLLFGTLLEGAVGAAVLGEIIVLTPVLSMFGYVLFPPAHPTIVLGCSGTVLAIMTYFCLKYPDARIYLPYAMPNVAATRMVSRIRVSAFVFLMGNILLNVAGYMAQNSTALTRIAPLLPSLQSTAFLGHLGGVAIGALLYHTGPLTKDLL